MIGLDVGALALFTWVGASSIGGLLRIQTIAILIACWEKKTVSCLMKINFITLRNLRSSRKQQLHARNSFKNKVFWKKIMKKP